jgi:cytochrome P450
MNEGFDDPDRLDLRRNVDNIRVGFGPGFHNCLGAARARLEGRIGMTRCSLASSNGRARREMLYSSTVRGRANVPVTAE